MEGKKFWLLIENGFFGPAGCRFYFIYFLTYFFDLLLFTFQDVKHQSRGSRTKESS